MLLFTITFCYHIFLFHNSLNAFGNNSVEIKRAQFFILTILKSGQCFIFNFTNGLAVFAKMFIEINSPQFFIYGRVSLAIEGKSVMPIDELFLGNGGYLQ
jgi:hypothetical protein